MEIRRLKSEDAKSYQKVRLEALKNNPEAFGSSYAEEKDRSIETYAERLASDESITIGAFQEAELVGTVTLFREKYLKLSHKANIFAMYVQPDKRGLGVGKKLLLEAINQANTIDGIEQLNLTVVATNEPAKNLYTSLGFEVFGRERHALKFEDGTYLDEEHMVLFL
ncbi:Ribosomal protein S18 acetylase RimI [Mesobacillus persicus]|uniref:Ribosomal protein S18 acetylase RimI n=1 Tax=Mesobacillus persicus TaxID=930146 RepID=A0A1H8EUJ2_9BACI|nr:N-acetyltransferase [Mesobacillus persicus]SEN23153.1 Ribosomal protein S18 acetylase RimI [Mesobacillus persicus]